MSVYAYAYVWDRIHTKPALKFALLALADFANQDTGECYPSIGTLAGMLEMTERNVQMTIRKLAALKLIQIHANDGQQTGTGKTNRYTILGYREWRQAVKSISPLESEGVKFSVARGEVLSSQGVKPTSPKPYKNPLLESKEENTKENTAPVGALLPPSLKLLPSTVPSSTPVIRKSLITDSGSNSSIKEKELKKEPPIPGNPPKAKRKPKLTERQQWMERLKPVEALTGALLCLMDKGYDPRLFDPASFVTIPHCEKYIPAAEELAGKGAKPEEMVLVYHFLQPKYDQNKWTIGLKSIIEHYMEWKRAHEQRQLNQASVLIDLPDPPPLTSEEIRQRRADLATLRLQLNGASS